MVMPQTEGSSAFNSIGKDLPYELLNGVINLQFGSSNYGGKLNSRDDWKNIVMESLAHQSNLSNFAFCQILITFITNRPY